MNFKIIFLSYFLFLFNFGQAQYNYKYEIGIGGGTPSQVDKLFSRKDYINYYEKSVRHGNSINLYFGYRLNNHPLILSFSANFFTFRLGENESDISIYDEGQQLNLDQFGIDLKYLIFPKFTLHPYILFGIDYNAFRLERNDVFYSCEFDSQDDYIDVNEISWKYDKIKSSIKTMGVYGAVGLRFRISDHIGIWGSYKVNIIPQYESDYMGEMILIYGYTIGLHYRFFKRMNYFI